MKTRSLSLIFLFVLSLVSAQAQIRKITTTNGSTTKSMVSNHLEYFAFIDGVEGDVTTSGYENWIRLNSIDFSINKNIQNNRPTGRADINFSFTKNLDPSSTELAEMTFSNVGIQNIVIEAVDLVAGNKQVIFKYEFKNVKLKSYHITNQENKEIEIIELVFQELVLNQFVYDSNGTLVKTIEKTISFSNT